MPRARLLIALCMCVPALAACGSTASTSSFKGVQHEVAQRVADLQSDVTSSDRGKICKNDLAGSIVTKLGGTKKCEESLKHQLAQIDNLETTIVSVKVAPDGKSATAGVKSTYEGKSREKTLPLVKEGASWKVSGPP
ncbi:MAG TPA: hypothetical protein VLZ06_11150 [Solirubrobacteraceae bacterium]|nr:hypothetical protein [Solirubrobacteraceae bacterium]